MKLAVINTCVLFVLVIDFLKLLFAHFKSLHHSITNINSKNNTIKKTTHTSKKTETANKKTENIFLLLLLCKAFFF